MSDIQGYIENIMKHYQLILLFKVNRINNKLVVKIKKKKNGYKLKLEALKSIKFVGITKKINRQNKKCRKCTKYESS